MKAILTGHTRGLGAAIAENLLARRIPLLGLARGQQADLAARFPAGFQPVQLDLADARAVAAWLAGEALGRFLAGSETVLLINNAGTVQPVGPLGSQDATAIGRAVDLNVTTPLLLANAVVAASPMAQDRRILHISSGAGRSAFPGWSVYGATKAALDHHARAVVLDGVSGLRISSLAPGVVDTDMQAEIRAISPERFPLLPKFQAMKRQGQLTSPQECAERLVAYLLSDAFGKDPVTDLRELPG